MSSVKENKEENVVSTFQILQDRTAELLKKLSYFLTQFRKYSTVELFGGGGRVRKQGDGLYHLGISGIQKSIKL